MKQFASILTILLLAVSFATAQDAKNTNVKADQKVSGAVIAFETETIDYGVIEQNADGLRIFKFKNTGTEPLIIKNAQGSCGCTVPSYSNAPVLPGETGEIKVKYATDRIGKFTKTVTLTTNATVETTRLTIKGEVLAKDKPTGVPAGEKSIINNN
ncbi:MAG: DUF1573 domain-containing protein [Saprospiraceae bacterium]|nr:DUF1573 domain-containing protein [Saprospiraceae bacterium]